MNFSVCVFAAPQIIVKVAICGERPPMDTGTPEGLRRLIAKCWAQEPRDRPSCAEVMRLTAHLTQQERRHLRASAKQLQV